MASISIEQDKKLGKTFFLINGVAHLLEKPAYKISLVHTGEILGPKGWDKRNASFTTTSQWLDGGDLCLEIDPRLVAHFQAGRAIEVGIDEIGVVEQINPPPLVNFQLGRRHPQQPRETVYPGQTAPPPAGNPPSAQAYEGAAGAPDAGELGAGGDGTPPPAEAGAAPDGAALPPPPVPARGEEPGPVEQAPPLGAADGEPSKGGAEMQAGRRSPLALLLVSAALVVGVLVGTVAGYFGRPLLDERMALVDQPTRRQLDNQIARLQTDAFGPLSDTIRQVGGQSPAGERPADVAPAMSTDRGLRFYNQGAAKAREGKALESVYWFKQSIKSCQSEAFTFLGDAYVSGEDVATDTRTGFQLLRLASALGSDKARSRLIELLRNGQIQTAPASMADAYGAR